MKSKQFVRRVIVFSALLAALPALSTEWTRKQSPKTRGLVRGLVDAQGVRQMLDIAYYAGPDADPIKHKLDLYLPEGKTNFSIIMFIHGGGWTTGDKRVRTDVYGDLGRTFAKQGIGVAAIDYRLSPQFKFPAHIQDAARAFAWIHKYIKSYGGNPDRIFVMGHSAGGHLTALLATDERWLKEQGLGLKNIRGAIPISGVYDFETLRPSRLPEDNNLLSGRSLNKDPEKMKEASPINYVAPNKPIPPFLIMWGERDVLTMREQAINFAKSLEDNGHRVQTVQYVSRNHFSTILNIRRPEDQEQEDILQFVESY